MKKLKVGVLGATGMVGQRFITLLNNHPWFEVTVLAASPGSAGKTYQEAITGKWKIEEEIPQWVKNIKILRAEEDMNKITPKVDLVFSALDMEKEEIKKLEIEYASRDVAVVSNNSAHRWTEDMPMIIPEVNPHHVKLIDYQRKNRGWKKAIKRAGLPTNGKSTPQRANIFLKSKRVFPRHFRAPPPLEHGVRETMAPGTKNLNTLELDVTYEFFR